MKSCFALAILTLQGALWAAPQSAPDLSQQIAEAMRQAPGFKPGHRLVHAKGIVVEGTFTASREARTLSRAAHFSGTPVPVTVRLSDSTGDPAIPDNSPDAAPRGFAIRFAPPGGTTDIVANSHNGFIVGTGEEFLALLVAMGTTDRAKPHPWPIEVFLGSHPRALKFVQDAKPTPSSFATEQFFGNNAFTFVNKKGVKQVGRYQIVPVAGTHYLDDAEAKAKSPDFLSEEIKTRLARGPVKFRLVVQLPQAGDPTNDSSQVWPDDRKTVDLGLISITSVVPDSVAAEKALAFSPTRLTDGIELSDDPLPLLRARVYAISVAHRLKESAADAHK
jgi:catalase